MAQQGLESVADLETYFEGRVLDLARQAGRNYIVWQVSLPLLHVRKSGQRNPMAVVVLNMCILNVSVLHDEALCSIRWAAFLEQVFLVVVPLRSGGTAVSTPYSLSQKEDVVLQRILANSAQVEEDPRKIPMSVVFASGRWWQRTGRVPCCM